MIDRRTLLASAGMLALGLSAPLQAQDKPTFALVQINQQALFFTQMNEGATQAAEKAGANLVIFNANNDPTAQNNAIETYIQQKVNGIIVVAIDTNGIMPAVKAADAAGIPVVAVDAVLPADGPQRAQIGVDNEGAGKMIGEHFVKVMNETMGGKSKIGEAKRYTDQVGGSGGRPYTLECPPGFVVTGIRGQAAGYVDQISLICSPLE